MLQAGQDIHDGKSQAIFNYTRYTCTHTKRERYIYRHFWDQNKTEIELPSSKYLPWHFTSIHKGIYLLGTQVLIHAATFSAVQQD